jgi:pantoate--beta-alanine ligase
MKRIADISAWRRGRQELTAGASLGFVPTMGALHAGHEALVKASVSQNDLTAVSIFINPTQFDKAADLAAYPQQLERDLDLLEGDGVDFVLLPDYEQLYPDDFRYRVTESELATRFCGQHRPGHFDGVLTVVMRLLNIVRPDRAYFGEKDYQQLHLVRGMVEAFFMDMEIVACPTVRAADGLALSSRNQRLEPAQREVAPALHQALRNSPSTSQAIRSLEQVGFDVEYVDDFDGRRLAAARLGEIRLIDNVALETTDAG